jgi:uncharacterized protein YbbC (DUF1343 family)/CubicO group peptidase (beta-lactamase class C family)
VKRAAHWRAATAFTLSLLSGAGIALEPADLAPIDAIVEDEIRARHIPGAVVLVGQGDRVLLRKAFGLQALQPERQAMRVDTVFDLASLTKAVVTTTAVLQLAERGLIELDAPAARYWPAFAARDKQDITVRQLLAHSSGLPAGIDPGRARDPDAVYQRIAEVKPQSPPGLGMRYSDVNFAALGKIVRRVSDERLDHYAQKHILEPLGMKHTRFRPPLAWQARIAPTSPDRQHQMRRGSVHDPLARALEGIAGHAGLFGTADDLARFARDLLSPHGRLLKPATVRTMLSPQTPPGSPLRGLGWRLDPPLASNRAALPCAGAASHYGFTGTALWLDSSSGTYMIALSSRLHPDERGDAGPLRARLATALSEALGPVSTADLARRRPELAGLLAPYIPLEVAQPVLTGIDVLQARQFEALRGKRIALLTHRSGVDRQGRRSIDVLHRAPDVTLVRLFSPEHGLASDSEGRIGDDRDLATGVPIYSLYGERQRPDPASLEGLDAVVVDLQDVGVRFYTYATTLAYLMESAAKRNLPVYVLDRPNPIRADVVQGPVLDEDQRSFTGYWPLPVRHGMTLGELARLFAGEAHIPVELHVIRMQHYRRGQWYEASGLPWLPPSPNLPDMASTTLYPGVGMIEGAEVSVGRGTPTPFAVVGAPWIDGRALSRALNARKLQGLRFEPATFTPATATYAGQTCHGVRLRVLDRDTLDTPALGFVLAAELHRRYPEHFSLERTLGNVGARSALASIRNGETTTAPGAALQRFMATRQRYLIYR